MSQAGYIYALINPSLDGMVKIGKTTRSPDERAKEISASTGVPTPFFVAYKIYVNDCDQAEKYMHTLLSSEGYRVSDNREFFQVPLEKVITLLMTTKSQLDETPSDPSIEILNEPTGDDFLDSLNIEDDASISAEPLNNPWDDIEALAGNFYYGLDEELQDYGEAIKLYKQAAALGSTSACIKLSEIYWNGEGCPANSKSSLGWLKKGAQKGSGLCYAKMAHLFTEQNHIDNANKCWAKYFQSDDFWLVGSERDFQELSYLEDVKSKRINSKLKPMILSMESEVLEKAKQSILTANDQWVEDNREQKYHVLLHFFNQMRSSA